MIIKSCIKCHKNKSLVNFGKAGTYNGKQYFRGDCKDCVSKGKKYPETRKRWEQRPEIKARRLAQKRTPEYREQDRIRSKQPHNQKRLREQRRRKYHNNIIYKLCKLMRSRLTTALKRKKFRKSKKTIDALGCTYEVLQTHIESLFLPGMTWENHGSWESDHHIPLASAKTVEDVYRLSHYTNIRPLWKEDNRSKSDKMPTS